MGARSAQAKPESGKIFDDWVIECENVENDQRCYASQNVIVREKNKRILKISVGPIGPKGQNLLVAVLPLGVSIQAGAAYKIDDHQQVSLVIQHCIAEGCVAGAPLDADSIKALQAGKTMTIGVIPFGTPQTVTLPVSLKGLSAALSSLK